MSLHDMGLGRYNETMNGMIFIFSAVLILRGIGEFAEAFDLLGQVAEMIREAVKEEYMLRSCGALLAGLRNLEVAREGLDRQGSYAPGQLELGFERAMERLESWSPVPAESCSARSFRGYSLLLRQEGEEDDGINWVYTLEK